MSDVRHNAPAGRFEAGEEANPAHLDYRVAGSIAEIVHTEVPAVYQGQGLAGKLATAALDWARAEGMKVRPSCGYVRGFIAKRPEYADLVE